MALLAGTNYDPGTAVAKVTSALTALTALDTTNLRLSFTVPANGAVLVRMRGMINGATTFPMILLGVLQGASVIARQCPIGATAGTSLAVTPVPQEAMFVVSGLTPGANLTWDASYAVQVVLASTALRYGGPNDTTANNAFGGFQFEVWEATNILGSILYDPAVAVTKDTSSGNLAMTAIDTTNLRITFTAPASGNVLVRTRGVLHGATTFPEVLFGVLESTTVLARTSPMGHLKGTAAATTQLAVEGQAVITGVSAGSHTYDAAYGVETAVASSGLKYGGPNDTAGNDAFGGFLFEIWKA